jgi:transposase
MLNSRLGYDLITSFTGLRKSRVFRLRSLFIQKGIDIFHNKPRRIFELLTKNQIKELCETIKTRKPHEVSQSFSSESFWTTSILCDFVLQKYNVRYKSKTSYYAIFRKTSFTYHKPGRVYVKQDKLEIDKWVKEQTPVIQQYWNDPNTLILCEDESLISTQTTTQKIWLESGSYPKVEVNNKKVNKSIYGFLDIKTGKEHAFAANYQTMYETAKILRKLRQAYPKKDNGRNKLRGSNILLLWDSAGWHKGSAAQEYIKKDGHITQIFFPRYSPQLNPQEHVWDEGKEKKVKNRYISNIDKTAKDFTRYLNSTVFKYKLLNFQA